MTPIKNLKLNKKKSAFIMSVLLLVFVGVLGYGNSAHAWWVWDALTGKISIGATVAIVTGTILGILADIIGSLAGLIVTAIVSLSSYNGYINEKSIIMAWAIIRDFCNMFFILILLIIAFATILRIESYNMKKWLPKLLIMAVLINFSRTIAGLIIDFSQVFMLTFVSAISANGSDYVTALGIQKYFDLVKAMKDNTNATSQITIANMSGVITGLFFGMLFLVISVVVLGVILAVLVIRMVMLWIYVVLSPLAFLLAAFPGGQKYASRWWDEFIKNVITGPILMFFVWLALISANSFDEFQFNTGANSFGASEMMKPDNFLHFIIAIGMLVGGLIITSQAGGAAGGMAAKGMGAINKGKSMAWRGTKTGAAFLPKMGVDKLQQKGYVDLNLKRAWSGMQAKRASKSRDQYVEGQLAAGAVMASGKAGRVRGLLAMTGAPGEGWDQISSKKGFYQRVIRGGKNLKRRADEISPKLEQAKFEDEFVNMNKAEREKMQLKLNSDGFAKLAETRNATDPEKVKKLKEEAAAIKRKHDFAKSYKINDNDEVAVKKEQKEKKEAYEKLQSKFDANTPLNNKEARAADQKLVSEKMSEISDITDGDEMIRMLKEAIKGRDKAMVKALSKKLTAQGDENEIMKAFGYSTGMEGLHKYSDMLKDKAGFGEQEALALGSDISQGAKGTNAWSVTGAYKMENGQWRKSSQDEQAGFVSSEAVKGHVQDRIRKFGRKAFGQHDENGDFKINEGGVAILRGFDNEKGIRDIIETGNQSAMEYLAKDEASLRKLVDAQIVSEKLVNAIIERGRAKDDVVAEVSHAQVRKTLEETSST